MSDDDVTAYHESGHAVMGIYLGGLVQSMSLMPESSIDWKDEFPRYGDTIIAWPRDASAKKHAIREISAALAGPVSENIYTGDDPVEMINPESVADWHTASQHAMTLYSSNEKAASYLASVIQELDSILRVESMWAAVAALADELLAHDQLDSDQIHETVGFWLRRLS